MSATLKDTEDSQYVGAKVTPTTKRRVQMRAAQLGYSNMSEYFRAVIEDDLKDADLPLE